MCVQGHRAMAMQHLSSSSREGGGVAWLSLQVQVLPSW